MEQISQVSGIMEPSNKHVKDVACYVYGKRTTFFEWLED